MSVIVVTRLRLRDPKYFDDFFAAAVAVSEQAKNSEGNQGADVLADANSVFWTATAWDNRDSMHAFVEKEPHLETMARIDEWCDEATFVDWEQDSAGPTGLAVGFQPHRSDGQVASLSRPTEAHQTRSFPAPVVTA